MIYFWTITALEKAAIITPEGGISAEWIIGIMIAVVGYFLHSQLSDIKSNQRSQQKKDEVQDRELQEIKLDVSQISTTLNILKNEIIDKNNNY